MDILSSDLLMSFLVSAANSYKHDSLVRPFPNSFMKSDSEKDFKLLQSAVKEVPSFHQINWKDTSKLNERALDLVKWTISPKRFKLAKILSRKFPAIRELCGETEDLSAAKPDYLFEVHYNDQEDTKFKRLCGERDLIHAYHGSRAENFHSILHNGLRNNLNKVSLFGEGIYLSCDLRVCQSFSPSGHGWEGSLFGTSLSCIAVCQVIDDPDVKCSVKRSAQSLHDANVADTSASSSDVRQRSTANLSSDGKPVDSESKPEIKTSLTNQKRSFIRGSEGGQIPDKYYVVRNDDLVRVKYLFVYAPNAKKDLVQQLLLGSKPNKLRDNEDGFKQFVRRHKFFFVMLAYVLVLGLISLWNSKVLSKWWRNVKGAEDDSPFLH